MSSPGPWGTVLHSVPKPGWGHYDLWKERWLSPYTPLHFQLRYSLGKENGMIVLEGERGGNRRYLLPILSNSNLHQPMFGKIMVPWLFSDSEQSASTILPITQSWELELPHMWPCSHMHVPIDWLRITSYTSHTKAILSAGHAFEFLVLGYSGPLSRLHFLSCLFCNQDISSKCLSIVPSVIIFRTTFFLF